MFLAWSWQYQMDNFQWFLWLLWSDWRGDGWREWLVRRAFDIDWDRWWQAGQECWSWNWRRDLRNVGNVLERWRRLQYASALLISAAITVAQTEWLQEQAFLFSSFWKLEVQDQGASMVRTLWELTSWLTDGHVLTVSPTWWRVGKALTLPVELLSLQIRAPLLSSSLSLITS